MSCAVRVCAVPPAVLSHPDNSRNERTVSASNSAGMGTNAMETFKLLKLTFGVQARKEHKFLSTFQSLKVVLEMVNAQNIQGWQNS